MSRRADVRAGEVFVADAKRGERHLLVEQVRGLGETSEHAPYAICREVLPCGKPARGHLRGVDRSLSFNVSLSWDHAAATYKMPGWYRRKENA